MTSTPPFDLFARDLGAYPALFLGNPLCLLRLDDAAPIASSGRFRRALDGPDLQQEERAFLWGQAPKAPLPSDETWMFPTHAVWERPDPKEVSELLFRRFDRARELLPTQRDIAPRLDALAQAHDADFVALVICDGLSYYDLPASLVARENISPCLVDGVSITQFGFREAVGRPLLSQRLFARGYAQQIGMTYFDTKRNELAGDLFSSFGAGQVEQIRSFDDGMTILREKKPARGFVQWAMTGLDALSHQHHDRPPREAYLEGILNRFDSLCEELGRGGKRVVACLTADHGLLWREAFDEWGGPKVVSGLLPEDSYHPRYLKGSILRPFTIPIERDGQRHSLFRAPFLGRAMRSNEWGVHGGVSAWESLVPMWIRTLG